MDFVNYLPLEFGEYSPSELLGQLKASNLSPFWQDWLQSQEEICKKFSQQWVYIYGPKGLGLRSLGHPKAKVVTIGNRESNIILNSLIKRVCENCKNPEQVQIVDATAGLLNDTQSLLHLGYKLVSYEAHPLIALLIFTDTQLKTQSPKLKVIWDFIPMIFNNGELLKLEKAALKVVLYDPMFHVKQHKSLPSAEMQLLRQLEEDFPIVELSLEEWLQWQKNADVLIVKRPNKAPYFLDQKPRYSVESKLLRWDVY